MKQPEFHYKTEATEELVEVFSGKLRDVLRAEGYEEKIFRMTPGGMSIYHYEHDGKSIEMTETPAFGRTTFSIRSNYHLEKKLFSQVACSILQDVVQLFIEPIFLETKREKEYFRHIEEKIKTCILDHLED